MSFWNFIGELAVFNMICDLFSVKSKFIRQVHISHNMFPVRSMRHALKNWNKKLKSRKIYFMNIKKIIDSSQSDDLEDYDID